MAGREVLRHRRAAVGGRSRGPALLVPDEQVTTEVDGSAYLAAKTAALRAHATQIAVEGNSEGGMGRRAGGGGRFALSDGRWQPISGREFFTLLAGTCGTRPGTREHDLFAGLGAETFAR